MKPTKGKKIGLMIFMLVILALIPITSVIADAIKMGDPTIEYVSSQLRVPEEMQKLSVNDTVTDAVYYLDVVLQATRRMATNVNGTLSFKENLRDYGMTNGYQLNRNLSITKDFSVWAEMNPKETKTTVTPFVIKGLNNIPEKITFVLELTTINPNDEKEYSKTIEFILTTFQTEIDILSINSPGDYYKGYQVPINIYIKNVRSYYATSGYVTIQVKIRSIQAGYAIDKHTLNPRFYDYWNGLPTALELTDTKTFSVTIQPLETKLIRFYIDFSGYSNGAMNIGEWKITQVYVDAGNAHDTVDEGDSDFNQHISDPYYRIHNRPKSMQPHPVFIYYLWNSGGPGDDWGGTNPLPWIIDGNGAGSVSAGLWRFNTYDSNIPVRMNMIICVDDSSWELATNIDTQNEFAFAGRTHVADKLNIIGGLWKESGLSVCIRNCGFDVLLMAVGRKGTDYQGTGHMNRPIVCKWGRLTLSTSWKVNIDGLAQHEMSHIFGCLDYGDGHPKCKCIMFYNWYKNYIYERIRYPLPKALQCPSWCSACQDIFNDNWNRFSKVTGSNVVV